MKSWMNQERIYTKLEIAPVKNKMQESCYGYLEMHTDIHMIPLTKSKSYHIEVLKGQEMSKGEIYQGGLLAKTRKLQLEALLI